MLLERVEKLRETYEGKRVKVASDRADLARFAGQEGCVRTINCNGRALVQFDGDDRSWYDVALDDLKVVEKPHRATSGGAASGTEKPDERPDRREPDQQPSPLEIARSQKRGEAAKERESPQVRPGGIEPPKTSGN